MIVDYNKKNEGPSSIIVDRQLLATCPTMQISRIGPFALEEPLGGAESNVFRGVHVELKRTMAVKLLPRQVVEQAMGRSPFADDVRRLQQLEHPCLVRVLGGAVEGGQPYLVEEYMEGESLRTRLERRGKLAWETAVEIIEPVCQALDYLHRHDWVHRRLTPDRILLGQDGQVKITGLDCVWADHDAATGMRVPMKVAHYLSPEQFRGHASARLPACDLYSLGVILHEALTGAPPWPADSPQQLVLMRREGPAPRISSSVLDCPVWLDLLAARLLEKKRSNRLKSADETLRAVAAAKQKSAAGAGAAQAAISGRTGALSAQLDRKELRKLRRSSNESSGDRDAPFYEQTWLLVAALALVGAFVYWVTRPATEDALFAKALPLIESDDPTRWRRAKDQYLEELLRRFPDTKYAAELEEFDRRYAMHRAEQRIINLDRFGRDPQSEAERQFARARQLERFGDLYGAVEGYEAVAAHYGEASDPIERGLADLARQKVRKIEAAQLAGANAPFLEQQLDQAKRLATEGKYLPARTILRSIVRLYGDRPESRDAVAEARRQLEALEDRP